MIHSFLLIGQSNMAGRGYLDEAREINCERIYTLRNGQFQPMFRPINPDRAHAGISLAESFAERYAEVHGVDVGLICCADGGSMLAEWQPGRLLYDHAVCQAKLAQRTSTIAGVLWHQGEADCNAICYPTYRERFETVMNALRKDLDLYDVPFLLGGIGDFIADLRDYYAVHYPLLNNTFQEIAKENPMTGYVSAAGLKGNPDNIHFSAEALYEFGHRYFEVFETLRDKNKVFEEKAPEGDGVHSEFVAL